MEERLDDAINVLRNHCEPQLPLTMSSLDDAQFVGTSTLVGAHSLQENCPSGDLAAVKMERLPVPSTNSSKTMLF